jgi:hypothetical protein
LVRLLTVVSGVLLLLLGGLWLLASTAPGPFQGVVGLVLAIALFTVGIGLLLKRGGVWLYPFAILLPLIPYLYALAVVLSLLPATWVLPEGAAGTDVSFVLLIPSLTAATALVLHLGSSRHARGLPRDNG